MICSQTFIRVTGTVAVLVAPTCLSVIGHGTPGPMLEAQTKMSAPPKPSPAELHAQAYAAMVAGDFWKAKPLLEEAYKDTPIEKRNRALVLNRAILDFTQKTLIMRGIKDLGMHTSSRIEPRTNTQRTCWAARSTSPPAIPR